MFGFFPQSVADEGDVAEGGEESLEGFFLPGFVFELASPNAYDVPSHEAELLLAFAVALAVAVDFLLPEGGVGARHLEIGTSLVAVPEAAVDEDTGAETAEDDVGGAGEAAHIDTVAEAVGEEETAHQHLGPRVAAVDAAHAAVALLSGHTVGHNGEASG